MQKILQLWNKIGKYGKFSIVQFPVFLILLFAVQSWQTKDLLSNGSKLPIIELPTLSGVNYQASVHNGKSVVVYIFAPWCKVCKVSSINVNRLFDSVSNSEVAVLAIALDYGSVEEVEKFKKDHNLKMPVLLGSTQTARNFKISGFPTFYFANSEGSITAKTIGFTTKTGLMLRRHL